MSADRDRGTRRQKQKRAKDLKKLAKQQRQPDGVNTNPAPKPAEQPPAA